VRRISCLVIIATLLGSFATAGPALAKPTDLVGERVAIRNALFTWWSPARADNYTSGTAAGDASARAAGYSYVRTEGSGVTSQEHGSVPLYLFWSAPRGDNFTTATQEGINSAYAAGYTYIRVEGYVYP